MSSVKLSHVKKLERALQNKVFNMAPNLGKSGREMRKC